MDNINQGLKQIHQKLRLLKNNKKIKTNIQSSGDRSCTPTLLLLQLCDSILTKRNSSTDSLH
jgi:hypothetical protein